MAFFHFYNCIVMYLIVSLYGFAEVDTRGAPEEYVYNLFFNFFLNVNLTLCPHICFFV